MKRFPVTLSVKYIAPIFVALLLIPITSYFFKFFDAKGGLASSGKDNYRIHCLSCHGEKGDGDGVLATNLPKRPSNLGRELKGLFSYDTVLIKHIVLEGKAQEGMPAFKGILTEEEVKDIFAYVRSLNE